MSKKKKKILFLAGIIFMMVVFCTGVYAEPGISISDEGITITSTDDPEEISNASSAAQLTVFPSCHPFLS